MNHLLGKVVTAHWLWKLILAIAIGWSVLPLPATAEPSGQIAAPEITVLQAQATRLFNDRKYLEAETVVRQILALDNAHEFKPGMTSSRTLINLAACQILQDKQKQPKQTLSKLATILATNKPDSLELGDCLFWLGEYWYRQGQEQKAADYFLQALNTYEQVSGKNNTDLIPCLEAQAGCKYLLKQYLPALELYKRILEINLGNGQAMSLGSLDALLSLADTLDKVEQHKLAETFRDVGIIIFRSVCGTYLSDKYTQIANSEHWAPDKLEKVIQRINQFVVGSVTPPVALERANQAAGPGFLNLTPNAQSKRTDDFFNWKLPGSELSQEIDFLTIDPTVEQKAMVVCVHGLGLNARAFSELANKLAARGFMVIAFNMRGFGTNLFSKGVDKFEPKACLDDIALVLRILHRDSPNVPVFLLGESAGGAMVLNLAARSPELVNGIICSVPSGQRFGSFSESMLVAGQYLSNSKRPFDIGQRIIEQATTDPQVRQAWSSDPINRRKLSAEELVAFQEFMNESERLAKEIKSLPVIMFQGLSDQLVRPEGSAQVYLSLDTKEKDFIVLGRSEHLIFEMGQTPSWIIEALCGWLDAHLPQHQKPSDKSQLL